MAGIVTVVKGFFGYDGNTGAQTYPSAPAAVSNVSPARSAARVVPFRAKRGATDVNEIFTIVPSSYAEASLIAENYREGVTVIVNMAQLSEQDAVFLMHFMAGLKEGLQGSMKRVTSKVFLLTPEHVWVSSNDESEVVETDEDDLVVRPFV
jgi:cell division inhibitor SepF